MFSILRRRFLGQAASAGIIWSADLSFGRLLRAQPQASNSGVPARVYVDFERRITTLDRNLFGSFLEHLGRAIYDGIFPGADAISEQGNDETPVHQG